MKLDWIKKNKIRSALLLTLLVFAFLFFLLENYSNENEREFFSSLQTVIIRNEDTFKLSEITDFEWDDVFIATYIDSSFENCAIKDYLDKNGIEYSFLESIYLSIYADSKCESFLIFTKSKSLTKAYKLSKSGLVIKKTLYSLPKRPIRLPENKKDTSIKLSERSSLHKLVAREVGATEQIYLIFIAGDGG